MSKPIISVENLSKAYRIGLKDEIPDTLTGALASWAKAPLRNLQRLRRLNTFHKSVAVASTNGVHENGNGASRNGQATAEAGPAEEADVMWALRDVSFDVHEGEVVGIIGRNGAGKSTLLKVLSRITEPTHGRATIRGRVSSLLEVGTGFHPELTGRENIYMNGTILGMRKKEIDRKFDEIVEFSGVEKFLDTPTKRYSSGMQVRLAFAVAAHLEPEILIIDEVLAVGDAEFQKKCLGKMQDAASSGKTVLFVSHNMEAVSELCPRCVLLADGTLKHEGNTGTIIEQYRSSTEAKTGIVDLTSTSIHRTGDQRLTVTSLATLNSAGDVAHSFAFRDSLTIRVGIRGTAGTPFSLAIAIRNQLDRLVAHICTTELVDHLYVAPTEEAYLDVSINDIPLNDGIYNLTTWIGRGTVLYDRVPNSTLLRIDSTNSNPSRTKGLVRCAASVRLVPKTPSTC